MSSLVKMVSRFIQIKVVAG